MPIDKNQDADGLRYKSPNGGVSVIHGWKIDHILKQTTLFSHFLPPSTVSPGSRQDYEVNDQNQLIRLGNQIEEELYPAEGLIYIDHDGWKNIIELNSDGNNWATSVAKVEENTKFFHHWANTPKNRELGLYKEREDMTEFKYEIDDVVVINKHYGMDHQHGKTGHILRRNPGQNGCCNSYELQLSHKAAIVLVSIAENCLDLFGGKVINTASEAKKEFGTPPLTSKLQEEMVHNQNRSLCMGDVTCSFKVRMPDGRILECPEPSEDHIAWEPTVHFTAHPGKCGLRVAPNGDLSYSDGRGYTVDMPILHNEGLCWLKDMKTYLDAEDKKDGGVHWSHHRPEIIEVQEFKFKGYTPERRSPSKVAAYFAGQHETFMAGIWPEEGHVSLLAGQKTSKTLCPLLNGPEKPRGKYDGRYWPERHAPEIKHS